MPMPHAYEYGKRDALPEFIAEAEYAFAIGRHTADGMIMVFHGSYSFPWNGNTVCDVFKERPYISRFFGPAKSNEENVIGIHDGRKYIAAITGTRDLIHLSPCHQGCN
jgi:hypothetical protein